MMSMMSDKELDELIEEAERIHKRNQKIEKFGGVAFVAICFLIVFNMAISSFVYSMYHPEKTRTEVFLRTFKSFIWDMNDD